MNTRTRESQAPESYGTFWDPVAARSHPAPDSDETTDRSDAESLRAESMSAADTPVAARTERG